VSRVVLWTNRHTTGAVRSRTRASEAGIVIAEGGGFYPTLFMGGGAGSVPARRPMAGRGGEPA
jgi:hypothetical protein